MSNVLKNRFPHTFRVDANYLLQNKILGSNSLRFRVAMAGQLPPELVQILS